MGFFMEKIYAKFLDCSGVSTDTRTIEKDNLFICLKGQNFNGNLFAGDAVQKGAKYVLIDEKEYEIEGKTILVDDCLKTLQELAKYHRSKFKIPVIGITGSNGKTTTKELTAHLLSQSYNILFTKGNLNNHIGVPLTLLLLKKEHQIAIIEMGANHPDDIKELCTIAEPDYGIISNIGKAHLEGFKNIEGVIKTKTDLYKSVANSNGTLFVNFDDKILKNNVPDKTTTIYYSGADNNNAPIKGRLIRLTPFIHFKWCNQRYESPELITQIIGEYNFYNLLAAITVANHFNVPPDLINTGIETYRNENNRSQLTKTERNELVMDAYNANPSSMHSAISSFSKIERPNKLMILGDMFELGTESEEEHRIIIETAERTNITTYFIGKNFYGLRDDKNNFFESKDDFINYIKVRSLNDYLILLKGSRGIALESLVSFL